MFHLGYCCINQTLRNVKPAHRSIFCGRSMTKKTFNIVEASKRALRNCLDLLAILEWNEQHNIRCFRISSDLLPRFTCAEYGYDFNDLPDALAIKGTLRHAGEYAYKHGHLLSFHPGPYTTLASPNDKSRDNAIKEFLYHDMLASMIDPEDNLYIPINIHVGGSYGCDFANTAQRFISVFQSLPYSAQQRLVLENDDKSNCWSVQKLISYIHSKTGIPITFDIHHWLFCHDNDTMEHDFLLAHSTWNEKPMQVHYSQSPTADKLIPAHSDYYRDPIPTFVSDTDNIYVHLECKQKELALLHYRSMFGSEIINNIQEPNYECERVIQA